MVSILRGLRERAGQLEAVDDHTGIKKGVKKKAEKTTSSEGSGQACQQVGKT